MSEHGNADKASVKGQQVISGGSGAKAHNEVDSLISEKSASVGAAKMPSAKGGTPEGQNVIG